MKNITYNVEYTDTFGGDANYSWVERETFDAPSDIKASTLVRRAKKALGLYGRHKKSDYGDTIRLDFIGSCTCAFIYFNC
jgi:hypothetical protein